MKKIVAYLFLILFIAQNLFSSDLSLLSLNDASDKELSLMCSLRNLDCGDSREQKIESLKKALSNDDDILEEQEAEGAETPKANENNINFEILTANSMNKLSSENELIILEGNVNIVFKSEKDGKRTLSAETIIIDINNSKLAALGNVNYYSGDNNVNLISQDISGEIITLDWTSNSILVTNGVIYTERENSGGDSVVFNATSSLLTLNGENNSLVLNDGFITTNPDTAYSSISAKKIALLNHGDMYLESAKISIGRVDVLYLPFFFSPGATMIGNPSIGYESARGSFVNTTFELLGKYPNFITTSTNSFNSLLKTEDSNDAFTKGSIYNSSETDSKLQNWAIDTDSFFTLFLDAYEKTPYSIEDSDKGSIVLGYDSQFNLINDALTINSRATTSFASDGIIGEIDTYDYYPIFRYDYKLSASLALKNGSLNISLPVVSDPTVRKTYSNRLSTFNIDALWNGTQSFPTTYSSDVTSFSWLLDGKYNFKPKLLGSLVKSINISQVKAQIDYNWEKEDGAYSYRVDSMTLPQLELNISGELVDFSPTKKKGESGADVTNIEDDIVSEILNSLYKSDIKEEVADSDYSSYNLSYIFKDSLYYKNDEDDNSNEFYNKSVFNLSSKTQIEPNLITHNGDLNFTYIYEDEFDDNSVKSLNITTSNIVSLPFLNLSYYFNSKLYKYSKTIEEGTLTVEESTFEFSDDFITKHAIEWKKTYGLFNLDVTPALQLVLPPLDLQLKPSLLLEYNSFQNLTVFSFDIDNSSIELTQIDNTLKYSLYNFNFNFNLSYDISESKTAIRLIDPLYLKSTISYANKAKTQYLSYSSKYYGLYDDTNNDYFSDFLFTYKNNFLVSKLNLNTQSNELKLDYFKNTISLNDYTKYWWKNRIGLKLNVDATFNYSFVDKYSTYLSLTGNLSFKIAKFMLVDFAITTSNYGFYRYYDAADNFDFSMMLSDLASSLDIFGDGRYSTQFNLEKVSLDFVHMMEDWDLHCKYTGSVVLSNYNYQWVPTLSIFLQWKTLPELKVDESFTNDGQGWEYNS